MPQSRRGGAAGPDNRLVEPLGAVLDRAPASWRGVVEAWRASDAGRRLIAAVEGRRLAGGMIYPANVLKALECTPRPAVRVVILGQDPYHGPGQAEGLAFSVPAGVRVPPSLRNILAELARDLGVRHAGVGHLGGWARQGVLLLNTALTVEDGQPGAHASWGWEALTDRVISAVAGDPGRRAFLLWGAHAQGKAPLIESVDGGRHLVLRANHPSPLSARRPPVPFLGCGHFGTVQRFLQDVGGESNTVDWST
ncbi:uracil-DNA glycosylase [Ideonella sp. A 288]|uniref:uracil-DNA glycosylase n=1 Tax=Ideonella sp. A 288 TaxID=1962181 RepID=UPI000B4A6DE6|nr:uracil-DNA glycosylase [Ideonella sp. A 288]